MSRRRRLDAAAPMLPTSSERTSHRHRFSHGKIRRESTGYTCGSRLCIFYCELTVRVDDARQEAERARGCEWESVSGGGKRVSRRRGCAELGRSSVAASSLERSPLHSKRVHRALFEQPANLDLHRRERERCHE